MAWAPVCTFPRFAHWCPDLSIMLKNIYEKTLNLQYIKLKFCMIIALGVHNDIYNFHLGSVSETRCAWWCPDLSPRPFSENISHGGIAPIIESVCYININYMTHCMTPQLCIIEEFITISLVLWNVACIMYCMSWRALILVDDLVPWLFTHPALPECTSSNRC